MTMLLMRNISLTVTEKEDFSHCNCCKDHICIIGKSLKRRQQHSHSVMKRLKFHIWYSIFADAELNVDICKFTEDRVKCGACDAQFISNSPVA